MTTQTFPAPWLPPKYDVADVAAIQACVVGAADGEQQKRAMRWIVESACLTYDMGWHPSGDHEASFAAGRRFVGLMIVEKSKLDVKLLKGLEANAA